MPFQLTGDNYSQRPKQSKTNPKWLPAGSFKLFLKLSSAFDARLKVKSEHTYIKRRVFLTLTRVNWDFAIWNVESKIIKV